MLNNLKRILIMNKIKILTVLSMMFGLLIMSVPVDSFAAGGSPIFLNSDGSKWEKGIYFPDTGYVCTDYLNQAVYVTGKYVLPKNLNKTSLGKLKGSFPGVIMEAYMGGKPKNYQKSWANILINKPGGFKIGTNFYAPVTVTKADNYCNKTKFDVMYKKYRKDFIKYTS